MADGMGYIVVDAFPSAAAPPAAGERPNAQARRGGFFAVDRRAWNFVCRHGINPAMAYLIMARGTGGDNRNTKWSTNAVETRTGISRLRSRSAIERLEMIAAVQRDLTKKRPTYRIVPADEIPACVDCADAEARPDWIWLPNTLVDSLLDEPAPVELVRQTGSVETLRLLINLYGAQDLHENGGIHFRQFRRSYDRIRVGEQGPFIVWGFVPGRPFWSPSSSFAAPHFVAARDQPTRKHATDEFLGCWKRLCELSLVDFVEHLIHSDSDDGEIIHPVATGGAGLDIEQELGDACWSAGRALTTVSQRKWAAERGVTVLAPVLRHIEGVQVVGVARLRHPPRTNRTLAFLAREVEWREVVARLHVLAEQASETMIGATALRMRESH